MPTNLTLVGSRADFQSDTGIKSPNWEHNVLLRLPGTKVLAIDELRSTGLTRLLRNRFFDLGQLYRISRAVSDSQFVLAQSEHSGYELALALRIFSPSKTFNIIFHGQRWWTTRNKTLAKMVARMKGGNFFCLSEALGKLLEEEYEVPRAKIHVTGYGVDDSFFRPSLPSEEACVVSAGTASRDYKTLVQASEGFELSVKIAADSTWYREDLNTAAMQIPASVSFFSAGDYLQLRSLYASALFVVVPLRDVRYACGYAVIAEAMAMGKAVIVSKNGAPSDLVEDGVTGIYVPPGDVGAMREAMLLLKSDPELNLRMGNAGRSAIEQKLNLTAYVQRLVAEMGMLHTDS